MQNRGAQGSLTRYRCAMDKPLLFMDVDGVLNPQQRRDMTWEKTKVARRGKTEEILFNPEHGALLQVLAAKTGAELVWATSWMQDANTQIAPLIGLPPLPVVDVEDATIKPIDFAPNIGSRVCEKTPAIAEYVKGRPFVWLDDDLTKHDVEYFRAHQGVGHFKLINISERWGLTAHQLYLAELWLLGLVENRVF